MFPSKTEMVKQISTTLTVDLKYEIVLTAKKIGL
jgi:hypothetical protein